MRQLNENAKVIALEYNAGKILAPIYLYIGNGPALEPEKIDSLCKVLNSLS